MEKSPVWQASANQSAIMSPLHDEASSMVGSDE